MKKKIILSFDYELFLGTRSGCPIECLILPTEKILDLLSECGLKGIFFIDTVYLDRLSEINSKYDTINLDLSLIKLQLTRIVMEGHYIFPHIHPHWKDAKYNEKSNEWTLNDYRYYRFHNISVSDRGELFERSINLLNEIIIGAGSKQPLIAYRAGGWSIQPFSDFKPLFAQHGLTHDFSVIPGRYQKSSAHWYDFRMTPKHKVIYRFSDDVCIEDQDGPFVEWTISTLRLTRFERWIDFKINGLKQRIKGMGHGKGSTVDARVIEEGDILESKNSKRILASLEGLNSFRVIKFIRQIRQTDYFQFISHPKLMSENDFKLAKHLFNSIRRRFEVESDFLNP